MTDQLKDNRRKNVYLMDDAYLNGWARICGWKASLVYMSLCRHADKYRTAFPSHKLMAEEHGVSIKTIRKGLKALLQHKLVKKNQKRNSKTGKFLHNTYILVDKIKWIKQPTEYPKRDSGHRVPSQGLTEYPHRPTKDTHKKDTHILSSRYSKISDIKEKELIEVSNMYGFPLPFVKSKLDDMYNWHEQDPQKNKKKNWLATLRNWVKHDGLKIRKEEHAKSKITFINPS